MIYSENQENDDAAMLLLFIEEWYRCEYEDGWLEFLKAALAAEMVAL